MEIFDSYLKDGNDFLNKFGGIYSPQSILVHHISH